MSDETREHDVGSLDCWCNPDILLPCDEHPASETCWKCEARNGCITLTRAEAGATDATLIIVHRYEVPHD